MSELIKLIQHLDLKPMVDLELWPQNQALLEESPTGIKHKSAMRYLCGYLGNSPKLRIAQIRFGDRE
jgi:Uma2 family endonuclease